MFTSYSLFEYLLSLLISLFTQPPAKGKLPYADIFFMRIFYLMEEMMFDNLSFNLKGIGYLCDITYQDNCHIAKINVIHRFNSGGKHSDDIWIHCVIDGERLIHTMSALKRSLDAKKTIILEFETQYISLEHSHYGMTEDDPNKIIFLKCRLIEIGNYTIDGTNPLTNASHIHNRFLENAVAK
jgi:hypothetical protein